ncbi:integrase catalytic domain-containing protein [Trichonephila clavipes]|nr:integrase catalytic domain-containing protein [Trichonephila clavipes]
MACERKLIESEATTGFFVLLGTKGKKETLEWCMKANLIASRYECPRFKKICVCKNERERLTATNGVAATSRKIIATTLFGVESVKELRALMDCINRNIRALKVLKYEQNDLSDIILINIILQKIDKESRKQFELSLKTAEVPTFDSIMKFLEKRSAVLENITRIPSTKMIHKNTAMSTKAKSLEGNVILQNTKFGYLVTGTLPQSQQQANCCLISEPSLDITVKKFFELESLPDDSKEITKSEEEIYCEEHFVSTYKRDKTGRFIVRLTIKENAETLLGYSKENAIKRLNGIWEKLNKNNTMGTLYKEFMNEYELLGHMEEIKNETLDKINYYIPHHSVYKPEKTSIPLRVVFDASAKTTSGFSLNSILLNGGIIQQDLFSIVSRFRKHEYAFSADIKKCTGRYLLILIKGIYNELCGRLVQMLQSRLTS